MAKENKKAQCKIRDQDPPDGICECKTKGIINPNCFENIGVCPSLKIAAIFHGYRIAAVKDD